MKAILITVMLVLGLCAKAQVLSIEEPIYNGDGFRLELIEAEESNTLLKYKSFTEENILIQEGYYRNGKPDGIWNLYDINGNIIATMLFDMNTKVKLTVYYEGEVVNIYYVNNQPAKKISIAHL
jgi:antitoxin component YwqK of YwqJK toxin-antitoxin module